MVIKPGTQGVISRVIRVLQFRVAFSYLKLKLSGMEGLTPVGSKSAVRSRRSLRRGSSRSAHGKQPRSGTQRFKGVSTLTGIELRLLEIPQEAIAVYEAKNASQPTLSSRTISEQSAPHLRTRSKSVFIVN